MQDACNIITRNQRRFAMKSLLAVCLVFLSCLMFAVDLPSLKNETDWSLRFPVKRHQSYKIVEYSKSEGTAAELTVQPEIFQYAELLLKTPVAVAETAEDFHGTIGIRLKADNVGGFVAVSARFEDEAGEIRQFRKVVKLRPGRFETILIPAGKDVRPDRVWGNRNRTITGPVKFIGLKFDCNPLVKNLKLTIDNLNWETTKQ